MADDLNPTRHSTSPDEQVIVGDHDFVVWGDFDDDAPFELRVANHVECHALAIALHYLSHEVEGQAQLMDIANERTDL